MDRFLLNTSSIVANPSYIPRVLNSHNEMINAQSHKPCSIMNFQSCTEPYDMSLSVHHPAYPLYISQPNTTLSKHHFRKIFQVLFITQMIEDHLLLLITNHTPHHRYLTSSSSSLIKAHQTLTSIHPRRRIRSLRRRMLAQIFLLIFA